MVLALNEHKRNSPIRFPWRTVIPAVVCGLLVALVFHVLAFGSWQGFHEGIDVNKSPFEDFVGPYHSQAVAIQEGTGLETGYLYPPTLAIFLAPLAHMPAGQAAWGWLAVLAIASGALFAVGLLWLGCFRFGFVFAYTLVFAWSYPWLHDMHWGQVSTLICALTLFGLYSWCQGRAFLAGLGLSLAIAIKLYPAWLVLPILLKRDRKSLSWIAGLCVLWLVALPCLYMGPIPAWKFYGDLSVQLGAKGPARYFSGEFWGPRMTQFLPAVFSRVWGGAEGIWLLLAWALPAFFLGIILSAARRHARAGHLLMTFILLSCAMPILVSPSWIHYFVWLPWALFGAWQYCLGMTARALLIVGMVLSSTPFFILVGGHPSYGLTAYPVIAALLIPLADLFSIDSRSAALL